MLGRDGAWTLLSVLDGSAATLSRAEGHIFHSGEPHRRNDQSWEQNQPYASRASPSTPHVSVLRRGSASAGLSMVRTRPAGSSPTNPHVYTSTPPSGSHLTKDAKRRRPTRIFRTCCTEAAKISQRSCTRPRPRVRWGCGGVKINLPEQPVRQPLDDGKRRAHETCDREPPTNPLDAHAAQLRNIRGGHWLCSGRRREV